VHENRINHTRTETHTNFFPSFKNIFIFQVARSLIVISNGELGHQNMGDVTQHLRKNNIRTVVVTVNEDEPDRRLADSVADDLHHTFSVKSFKDLVGIIEKTVNAACYGMSV